MSELTVKTAQSLNSTTPNIRNISASRFRETIADKSKLKSLEEIPGSATNNFIFPLDLSDSDHWVSFRVAQKRKFRAKSVQTDNTQCFITLPVPAALSTGYKAGYQNEDLGLAGGTVTGNQNLTADEIDKKFSATGLAKAAGASLAQSTEATALAGGAVTKLLGGGTVASILGGGAGAAVSQIASAKIANAGFARNPHQAVLFKGTGFRSHSFEYKFIAKNEDESTALTDIITAFKYFMSPKLTDTTHFFEYPEEFDIDFKNSTHFFDIGSSVLSDFNVNYHADGEPIYFKGGRSGEAAPFSVNISMTFQETTITTKDEIANRGR